jgi:DNA-binding beta-propeller fold protein YncE
MVLGSGTNALRYFTLSQNIAAPTGVECNTSPTTQSIGEVTGIELPSYSSDPPIPVGRCPVYAVVSSDGKRLFVLNRGDDTLSVINAQNDTLDTCSGLVNQAGQPVTCHPTLPLSLTAVNALNTINPGSGTPSNGIAGMTQIAGPVYAEYNSATNQLVVANYDGNSISIIDVSLDEYGNDSPTFGTTYTVPVGSNPASVTVLYDGSRAYTANQTDQTMTIVNLNSHTVEKTLPVSGHPRTVVSTQNSTQGKVYVASPDSNVLTLIRTDQDIVDTTLLLEGNVVDVRVSTQNGMGGNNNNVSRLPGYGQPCNLPGAASTASLVDCQALP